MTTTDSLYQIKVELYKRRRKIKELALELGEDYQKVQKILCGFAHQPHDFRMRVDEVLRKWDVQEIETVGRAA